MNRAAIWMALAIGCLGVSVARAEEPIIKNPGAELYFRFMRLSTIDSFCADDKFINRSPADEKRTDALFVVLSRVAEDDGIGKEYTVALADQILFGEEYSTALRFKKYIASEMRPIETVPGGFRYKMSEEEWKADKASKKAQLIGWCTKNYAAVKQLLEKYKIQP